MTGGTVRAFVLELLLAGVQQRKVLRAYRAALYLTVLRGGDYCARDRAVAGHP